MGERIQHWNISPGKGGGKMLDPFMNDPLKEKSRLTEGLMARQTLPFLVLLIFGVEDLSSHWVPAGITSFLL